MNHSKLYVPNPQKWVQFFDKVAKVAKVKQSGGGKLSEILPLDKYMNIETQNKQLPVKTVSPAEQTVEQAKSELEREHIKPTTIKSMNHNLKKRRRRQKLPKKNRIKVKRIHKGKIYRISRKQLKGGKNIKRGKKRKSKSNRKKKDIFEF